MRTCRYVQVLKDFGVFLVKSYAEVSGIDDVKLFHESAMILIALLASLPFWIRVRQCWVQFEGAAGMPTYVHTYLDIYFQFHLLLRIAS